MKKKDLTIDNLLLFIRMTVLGLQCNPYHYNVAKEIEKLFNETFKKKLV